MKPIEKRPNGQGLPYAQNQENDIKAFEFKTGAGALLAEVRTIMISSAPWFFATDVCIALGLTNAAVALLAIDDEDKIEHKDYLGSGRKPMLINESGLYTLIIKSRKEEAKRFKRWITADVLPEIRRTGSFNTPASPMPLTFAEALRAAADLAEQKEALAHYARRQARYIGHLENLFTEGLSPVQFCKRLNGVNTSKVNAFLKSTGWLYDDRQNNHHSRWRVYSYARDKYLTETSHTIAKQDKESFEAHKPILLHKGAVWLYRKYLKGSLPMKKNWDGVFTHDKELEDAKNDDGQ